MNKKNESAAERADAQFRKQHEARYANVPRIKQKLARGEKLTLREEQILDEINFFI